MGFLLGGTVGEVQKFRVSDLKTRGAGGSMEQQRTTPKKKGWGKKIHSRNELRSLSYTGSGGLTNCPPSYWVERGGGNQISG